ncbi:esterase/lipase family protein [Sandaracinus amylolyticus]|uniref:esterase/lipase family protein n=1 Tax=Sandaracinus amylolyticus TaxID=927083 RepID=UPI001F29C1FE|nr:hypothetical protein [Sandaracinus amylolyticus]UJR81096.1 Hypothetical protein I5071_31470 [Sandaracinus amylolyticus]
MQTPARWRPEGFDAYRALYPATPAFALPDLATTSEFATRWTAMSKLREEAWPATFAPVVDRIAVVFVRGYLGNWMPGNLMAPTRALRALGIPVVLHRSAAEGPIARNARMLGDAIRRDLPSDRELVIAGHSRGGLEARWLVAHDDELAKRTTVVLTSQTPRGPSPVLESMLLGEHRATLRKPHRRIAEGVQRVGLHAIGAATGGRELTREGIARVVETLARAGDVTRVIQTASWSSVPTTWLDSFHERLGEIAPGRAHDGQFFLDDLVWPGVPHVLLPHLDHAQPAMGGHGFDHVRYWLVMLSLALQLEVSR